MARSRGSFGHRPHSTANLTALIAQLYREKRAAEDRVMFDAYQNGGKGIDGKPVNDATMKKYIIGRRNEMGKGDPLYAEWDNRLTQINFKIGEEKVQLAYKQGKVGAGAVASYYRGQLSKIPQDSAFYRDVAGRAAEWAKAGAAAARGRARGRLASALEGKMKATDKVWANYGQLEGILTEAAKRQGLIAGTQTLTDADATDLEAFLKRGVPGPKGTTITFDDWRTAAVSAYKAFDTKIAINKQLNRGTKELTTGKAKFLNQYLVRINTIDDRAKYEVARESFQQATAGMTDPRAILDEAAQYASTLDAIRQGALKGGGLAGENDPEFIGGLENEIGALSGKQTGFTVADLQRTSTESVSGSDAQSTADTIAKAQADVEALANGTAVFGQAEFGSGFKVIPLPPASHLDPFGKSGLDESYQPAVVNIDGRATQVMLKGMPILAKGLAGPNGEAIKDIPASVVGGAGSGRVPIENLTGAQMAALLQQGYKLTDEPSPAGYVFTQNGSTTYGIKNADGTIVFTKNNPFDTTNLGKDGLEVFVGTTTNAQGDAIADPSRAQSLNLTDPTPYLVDSSISPKDLRALASVSDSQTATSLLDLAATRENNARTAAANKENLGGTSMDTPFGKINPANTVNDIASTFKSLAGTIASIFGPQNNAPTKAEDSYRLPELPKLSTAAPSFNPVVTPAASPTVPKTTSTFPTDIKDSPTYVSSKEDMSPASKPNATASSLGSASAALIDKYLHPTDSGASPGK